MRQIEFRGKRKDNGEWVYGYYVAIRTSLGEIHRIYTGEYEQDNPDYPTFYEVIPESVGQFTGLKDKDGKEIYEGDLVTFGNSLMEAKIVYDIESTSYRINYIKSEFGIRSIPLSSKFYDSKTEDLKVIGNTTDNPELLEVK